MWKDVKGYEGLYQVSDQGEVKSLRQNKILKPTNNKGHLRVVLTNSDGVRKSKYVHRLVAEAFIPNPFNLSVVDHIDECKTNNRVSNLQWLTTGENTKKSSDYKIKQLDYRTKKLSLEDIKKLRYSSKYKGMAQKEIAMLLGVSQSRISDVLNYRAFKNV